MGEYYVLRIIECKERKGKERKGWVKCGITCMRYCTVDGKVGSFVRSKVSWEGSWEAAIFFGWILGR